ncbi:MAG: hypothetical protein EZS28_030687, partial [Streblomastix strix]
YTIEDIMMKKILVTHTEFMTWLTRIRKTEPSLAKHHASILDTMLSLIFGTVSVSSTVQRLNTQSEWKRLQIQTYLYRTLMISIELQQFASHLNNLGRERYDVRKTNDPRVYPTNTFFYWLVRLRKHFQQGPTDLIHIFWTENWKHADQRYISAHLDRLIQTYGIKGATANSIRHASSTELAAQSFDGKPINIFTNHTSDSKMNQNLYIFAVNREQDSIASALVNNHGEKQATYIISKQRGEARVSEGAVLQQSPLGDDLQ